MANLVENPEERFSQVAAIDVILIVILSCIGCLLITGVTILTSLSSRGVSSSSAVTKILFWIVSRLA